MQSDHGTLTYETEPIKVYDPNNGYELIEPCVLSNVYGEFSAKDGRVIKLMGKCFNEYEGGKIDPSKLQLFKKF